MNDLSIRVSATDMASNVLAAVGDNVKNLGQTASSSFNQMQASSAAAAQAANAVGSSSAASLSVSSSSIGTLLTGLTSVVGISVKAALAIGGIAITAVAASNKAEKELSKVGNTLKLIEAQRLKISVDLVGDGNIDPVLAKVKQVADQIELATNIKSSKIVNLAGSATQMGFDPGKMDQTMKGAAGLSAAFGTSLDDGLSKVRQAAEGNFAAFETLIPGIQLLSTEEEKLAAVAKLASDGLIIQAQAVSDSEGMFSRLYNGVGNLFERMGSGAPIIETVSGVLSDILFPVIDFVDQKMFDLGNTTTWLKDMFVAGFSAIAAVADVTWNNFGLILERAKISLFLFAEQSALDLEHTFTVKMPSYVVWFGDNFLNILQDLGAGALTIVSNLGSNIADAFGAYWHYITEGWSQGESLSDLANNIGNIATRNLLDGFEPVTTELPRIAERAMSATEKSLLTQMKGIDDKLAKDFSKAFENSVNAIDTTLAKAKLNAKIDFAGIKPPKPQEITQNVESKVNQAIESRVMVRGPMDDPMERLLDVQQRSEIYLQTIASAVQKPPQQPNNPQQPNLQIRMVGP